MKPFARPISLRGMMVLVALAGLVAGLAVTGRRWATYRDRAAMYHRLSEGMHRRATAVSPGATVPESYFRTGWTRPARPVTREIALAWSDEYRALALRYEHAARRPWLALPPDPPLSRPLATDDSPLP